MGPQDALLQKKFKKNSCVRHFDHIFEFGGVNNRFKNLDYELRLHKKAIYQLYLVSKKSIKIIIYLHTLQVGSNDNSSQTCDRKSKSDFVMQ
jgi:hypothetical protein